MRTRVRGFSLVEVLVALIVICVGLLGVAKMQALALSNMTTSRLRALAAFEAAALAGAMHSNRNYWAVTPANFAPNYSLTVTPSALAPAPVFVSSDAALVAAATTDYPANLNTCVGTNNGIAMCPNATNLAAYDLANWANSLKGLLPNPSATISCPSVAGVTAPVSCTILITWTERAVSMTAQAATQQAANPNAAFETPSYLLYVEP